MIAKKRVYLMFFTLRESINGHFAASRFLHQRIAACFPAYSSTYPLYLVFLSCFFWRIKGVISD